MFKDKLGNIWTDRSNLMIPDGHAISFLDEDKILVICPIAMKLGHKSDKFKQPSYDGNYEYCHGCGCILQIFPED